MQDEDNDVAAERQRIYDGGSKTNILQIRDLSKVKPICSLTAIFSFESLVLYEMKNHTKRKKMLLAAFLFLLALEKSEQQQQQQ